MDITQSSIIGEIVAADYRAAEVFSKFGIDFCCKGNLSIDDACTKKKLDASSLVSELLHATRTGEKTNIDYAAWPVDLLADYIEKKHHRYITEKTPVLQQYLKKISSVHGAHHPELIEIAESFNESAQMLAAHMKKEELILFPFVRRMAISGSIPELTRFGTVENPITMMKEEHSVEGERFSHLAKLSNNYTPPSDACNTYRVTYALLKEFEQDLHLHIHLENNILFPKAIQMEQELSMSSCRIV